LFLGKDLKRIGTGGVCRVYEVENENTNRHYTLKEIAVAKLSVTDSTNDSSTELEQSKSLIGKILKEKSAYLVYYEEIFSEGDNEYIFMELFRNGDLQSYLGSGKKLKEKVIIYFFILLVIIYLFIYL
jgi:serine/threonine protein kinase